MKKLLSILVALSIVTTLLAQTAYVTATKLNARTAPSAKATILAQLPFGQKVEIIEQTDKFLDVNIKGISTRGRWVKVRIVVPFYYNSEVEDFLNREVYVLDAYLHQDMRKIPPHALYLFSYLRLEEYFDAYIEVEPLAQNPNPLYYYELADQEPRINKVKGYWALYQEDLIDSLQQYIKLELVAIEDYQDKKMANPYTIDPTAVQINTPLAPPDDKRFESMFEENAPTAFYLPIDEGKDSVLIHDFFGEYYMHRFFGGQIHPLQKYLFYESFEEIISYTVDKKTGAIETFTAGTPFISPDGHYLVGLNDEFAYDNDCSLSIATLDEKGNQNSLVSAKFTSFTTSSDPESSFWVSNNELIIKVYSRYNYELELEGDAFVGEFEYLKLTLLK